MAQGQLSLELSGYWMPGMRSALVVADLMWSETQRSNLGFELIYLGDGNGEERAWLCYTMHSLAYSIAFCRRSENQSPPATSKLLNSVWDHISMRHSSILQGSLSPHYPVPIDRVLSAHVHSKNDITDQSRPLPKKSKTIPLSDPANISEAEEKIATRL
jgi:hypothetical protein